MNGKADCVPRWNTHDKFDSKRCIAMGWGIDRNNKSQTFLQETMLPMVLPRICQFYHYLLNWKVGFCAGYHKATKYLSSGDSGGPFICPVEINGGLDYKFVLVGINSAADPRCPSFFVKVNVFELWINQTMNSL